MKPKTATRKSECSGKKYIPNLTASNIFFSNRWMWHWLDCNLFPLKNSASNTINKNIETIIQFFLEVRQVCSNIIIKNEKIINYVVFWKTYYEFQKSPLVPSPHHFQKVKDSGLAAFNLGWPRLSWGNNFLVSPFKWTKTPIKEQLLQKIINKKRAVEQLGATMKLTFNLPDFERFSTPPLLPNKNLLIPIWLATYPRRN